MDMDNDLSGPPAGEGPHVPGAGNASPGPVSTSFLSLPERSDEAERLYAHDLADHGFVMNLSRVWAHVPEAHDALFGLLAEMVSVAGLTFRQRGVLVTSTARSRGDSYCSLAWGARLAAAAGDDVAEAVLAAEDAELDATDRALAQWARAVATDPNAITAADVEPLRRAGFDDRQIFAITTFVALRLAFSTVNDALGAQPDRQLVDDAPAVVREGISWGREPAAHPSATS
ncbi:putative peroxidase-related enzyme [Humibacillus xanthopallidus]|uniref:Putative peroxidase-related enzyme n=2 Tax=Humibacillus xanthopallidus TaxID=412689 RepID=A0A543I105_9MICO|nr:putative peroxidase-related enzyme [Humibacillus xanthopallidus]